MDINSRAKLNNGTEIPYFGLGVYQARSGQEVQQAVKFALEADYRHIDTAMVYGNERDVGEVIRKSGIPREEIFITTKLWNSDHGYEKAINACNESLQRLGLEYIDLYLVHWPVQGLRHETWKAMEALYNQGKCKAIGVSNYMVHHLEEVLNDCSVVPAVNQVELSPYLYRRELVHFCESNEIKLEAYSPLTKGIKLKDPKLVQIAAGYNKSTAQILIKWCLQHDFIVIPKSVHKERIIENADVFDFELSREDMSALDSMNEDLATGWDPTEAP